MKTYKLFLLNLIIITFVLSSCNQVQNNNNNQEQIFLEDLKNAEYPIDLFPTGSVRLEDGHFSEPAAPGSASMNRVFMEDTIAIGDINSDGKDDAASILIGSTGGTGAFYYLAASLNQDGHVIPVATTFLGDRIIVYDISIEKDNIHITYFVHAPDQPMAEEPTQKVEKTYKLEDKNLVEISS